MNDEELLAANNYTNAKVLSPKEFYADFSKFSMIAKLFKKHKQNKLNYRLVLNHLIILFNNFKSDAVRRILYNRLDEKQHPALNAFFVYLSQFDKQQNRAGIDMYIFKQLQKL